MSNKKTRNHGVEGEIGKRHSRGRQREGLKVQIFRGLARLSDAPNLLYLGPNPLDVEVMHAMRRVEVDLSDEHLVEVLGEWAE